MRQFIIDPVVYNTFAETPEQAIQAYKNFSSPNLFATSTVKTS